MGYYLGVDLGTTWTAAAINRGGRVEVVTLGNQAASIPSVIYRRDDGDLLFGDVAAQRAVTDPLRVAREFKRRIGDPTPIIVGGTPYAADHLMSKLLRWVVDAVTEREGEPPEGIAVSHPANWGQFKLDLLGQAVRLADLPDATLLSEPEAAAIHYASNERIETGQTIAVYDLGGGTFDAAILTKSEAGWRIAGNPEGIERLGGIDIDEAIFSLVTQSLGTAISELDTDEPASRAAMARLRQDCVVAKEALSTDTEAIVPVHLPGNHTEVRVTRRELEDLIRPTITETLGALDRALRSAGVTPDELHAVLLVGGSSRIPLISAMVTAELGRPVAVDTHPKHAVASGAALAADPGGLREAAAPPPVDVQAGGGDDPPTTPPPPGDPTTAGEPPDEPPSTDPVTLGPPPTDAPPRRRRVLASTLAVIVAALVVAGIVLLAGGDNAPTAAASTDVELIPAAEPGPDPFTSSTSEDAGAEAEADAQGDGPVPTLTASVEPTAGRTVDGGEPGLYGGSNERGVCDTAQLVDFLTTESSKAGAWADALGISRSQIPSYVESLTPLVLSRDTAVTNHGFRGGRATPFQAVLQAGTAVLVDNRGVPRVKCNCGNPLAEPSSLDPGSRFTGTAWSGFSPDEVVVVQAAPSPLESIEVTDLENGEPITKALPDANGRVATTTTTTTTTTRPTTTTTTTLRNIGSEGTVSANSTYPGFDARLATDGSTATSWFSTGPSGGDPAVFTWTPTGGEAFVGQIRIIGNGNHSTPDFRTGFGFGSVTTVVHYPGGSTQEISSNLSGTPDPTVTVDVDHAVTRIELRFSGHEANDCGGFSELEIMGN